MKYRTIKALLVSTVAIASVPAHAELKALYTFDNSSNVTLDSSSNSTIATNYGATYTSSGYQGGALSFDGNDHMRVSLDVGVSSMPKMTWGAWVNLSNNAPIKQILSADNGGYDRSIGMDNRNGTTGQFSAFTGNGSMVGNGSTTLNSWTFVAAVYDNNASTVSLWVNGAKQTSTSTTFNGSHSFFDIAHNPSHGEYFAGKIDNVFVFNEALSDARISDIYQHGVSALAPVPEPETYAMLLAGLGLMAGVARRKQK